MVRTRYIAASRTRLPGATRGTSETLGKPVALSVVPRSLPGHLSEEENRFLAQRFPREHLKGRRYRGVRLDAFPGPDAELMRWNARYVLRIIECAALAIVRNDGRRGPPAVPVGERRRGKPS